MVAEKAPPFTYVSEISGVFAFLPAFFASAQALQMPYTRNCFPSTEYPSGTSTLGMG